jgi:hypothetical protein
LLALLLAAFGIVALQVGVAGGERAQPPAPAVAAPLVSPLAALGFVLQPAASPVLLCHRLSALAPDVGPVVQVLADGSVALRRPPTLPRGPASEAATTRAGIVLPVARLRDLGPAARGTLVALLAALAPPRPLPPEALLLVDVDADATDLAAILSWVP